MHHKTNTTVVLAGDIGGTKSNLGLFGPGRSRPVLHSLERYPSRGAPGFENVLDAFAQSHPARPAAACFGVAGPVVKGRSRPTNLSWTVSEAAVRKRFGWRKVRLVNDLVATAAAIPLLHGRELCALNAPPIRRTEPIALVAPGTGLGTALLMHLDGRHHPLASEGGHTDFSPTCRQEAGLWAYLQKRFGHVSLERALSGSGLVNIYSWLRDSGRYREPRWLSAAMTEGDPPGVISTAALSGRSPLCAAALRRFVSILGSVAGDLALTGMTLGGVFLGGGIPPKILPALQEGTFMKAFVDKGRMKPVLEKVAVRVVLNDHAALLGAAALAVEEASARG